MKHIFSLHNIAKNNKRKFIDHIFTFLILLLLVLTALPSVQSHIKDSNRDTGNSSSEISKLQSDISIQDNDAFTDGNSINIKESTISGSSTTLDSSHLITSSPPELTELNESDNGYFLNWSAETGSSIRYEDGYELRKNGTTFRTGEWQDGEVISHSLDDLERGNYQFSITFYDNSLNLDQQSHTDTVYVRVYDNTAPAIIIDQPDIIKSESDQIILSWNITDNHPDNYEIYRNDATEPIVDRTWQSGELINYTVIENKGEYNFTLVAYDDSENSISSLVQVKILDTTNPVITSTSGNVTYAEGTTGNKVFWVVEDNYPDNYTLYKDGVQIKSEGWSSGNEISQNVDGLAIGQYNYTLIIDDKSNNTITSSYFVSVLARPVILSSPQILYQNSTINYETKNNYVEWNVSDTDPHRYEIYIDGSLIQFGNWSNYDILSVNITEYPIGTYNFTLFINDTVGNGHYEQWNITVSDIPRLVGPIQDQYIIPETQENISLEWMGSDSSPDWYFLQFNSTQIIDTWNTTSAIFYNFTTTIKGYYLLNLTIFDIHNNSVSDLIEIIVEDQSPPVINNFPTNQTIAEYDMLVLTWNTTELYPHYYEIYINGTLNRTGLYQNNQPINLNVSEFTKGYYIIEYNANDTSSQSASHIVYLTIEDQTAPVINNFPNSFSVSQRYNNRTLVWEVFDNYPSYYEIYSNDTKILTSSWTDTQIIGFDTSILDAGLHNISLYIYDEDNQSAYHSVTVEIYLLDIIPPDLSIKNNVNEADIQVINASVSNSFDSVSGIVVNASVKDSIGELIYFYEAITGENGNFELWIDYSDFKPGNYSLGISYTGFGYINQTQYYDITVLPHQYSVTIQLDKELRQNQPYQIRVYVNYSNTDNSILSLDQLSKKTGPAEQVNVSLSITIKYLDGDVTTLYKSDLTDDQGEAILVLTAAETNSIDTIENLDFNIEGSDFNDRQGIIYEGDYPSVIKKSSTFGTIWNIIRPYLLEIIIAFTAFTIIFSSLYIIRRKQITTKQRREKRLQQSVEYIQGINSIRTIYLQDDTGTQYFKLDIKQIGADTTLIGGLTSAISAFLGEVSQSDFKGFETMERQGLSVIIHKADKSSLVFISDTSLSMTIMEEIEHAHEVIEEKYKQRLTNATGEMIPQEKILNIMEENDLNIGLAGRITFTLKSMDRLSSSDFISNSVKEDLSILIELYNDDEVRVSGLKTREVIDFMIQKGHSRKEATSLILQAYENNILFPLKEGFEVVENIDLLDSSASSGESDEISNLLIDPEDILEEEE